ncbi:M48 family metallopeptidase [Zeaxanthinibacter enoshimensis]|uniref:STE24 endopeptidase n=1 Tax=Zeaxanthinibacter enoshimensis TaxID=392009 RepID=A0A4R6TGV4_9FLAO|nr:M48 family metallopeptidase [Zeaxanthinibacter enoshimensis]TDQ29318.1 STE24 endopeptidase [Zeaxanthinibacter enoshimensis]
MNHQLLFIIIISLLVLQFAWETWLNFLNARHFSDPVPESLSDVYEEEQYAKSQAYKYINYRFGLVTSAFSLVLTLLVLFLGGFEIIDQWVRSITDRTIPMALLFFGLIFIGTDLLTLPFSYYHTFVIEERFGFNKTTPRLFFIDKLKSWLLMAMIGGGIMTAVILLYQLSGAWFWLYAWLLIAVFTVFMNLFYSKLIVPLFNKQTPLENGSLRDKIEAYAKGVGFELKNIFIIDGSKRSTKANAYFSGFGKEKRVTLFDTLVNDLEEEEIVAVLAHEVGHYKKNHILINLAVAILTTGLTLFLLSLFINNPEFSLAIGVSQPSFHAALVGFGLLYSPVSECTGLLMNYISRKFEYQADHYAKSTYSAEPLISSLKKLSKNNLSNLTPHKTYVFVHYSHPPLKDRIRELRA